MDSGLKKKKKAQLKRMFGGKNWGKLKYQPGNTDTISPYGLKTDLTTSCTPDSVCNNGWSVDCLLQSVSLYHYQISKMGTTIVMQENVPFLEDTGYGATYSQMVQEEGKKENTVCIHRHIHRKMYSKSVNILITGD